MNLNNTFSSSFRFITILALLFALISCENDIAIVNLLTVDESTPIESSFDVDMEYSDSGRLVMVMHTPEANRYPTEEEYMEMPKGMNMVFFDSLGQTKSDLSSEYAINYVEKKTMEARINVVATNAKGDKLYTELLIWDQTKKTIYTDAPVRVIQDGMTLYGDGLVSDETFTDYKITNPRGEFEIDSDDNSEGNNSDDFDEKPKSDKKEVKKERNTKTENKGTKKSTSEEDEFEDFDTY